MSGSQSNGNGNGSIPGLEGIDMSLLHRFMLTMNSNGSLLSRSASLKQLIDPRRDYDDEFGYPETYTLVAEDYRRLYEREAIAARVVEVMPSECWNTEPDVWEDEDVEVETEFEEDWNALPQALRNEESHFGGPEGNPIWEALARVDRLSRIGHFGVLVLGINDGLPLYEPIRGIEESGSIPSKPGKERGWSLEDDPLRPWVGGVYNDRNSQSGETNGKRMVLNNRHHYEPVDAMAMVLNKRGKKLPQWSLTVNEKKASKNELIYVKAFDEVLVDIIQYEMNPLSPRYGYPTEYSITFNNPFLNVATKGGIGLPINSQRVHWTRVIHVVNDRDASDLFGVPAQRPVLNHLLNLHKVYGGDAEAYFRGCVVSHSLETHPQLGPDAKIDWDIVKDQYEQFSNSMSRIFGIAGASLKSHAPQITDPTSHINIQIEAICIKLGQPKRIFMGSERGELSSTQDSDYWVEQVKGQQKGHCIPHVIVPFVDRLILIGAVRPPKDDGYSAGWTEEDTMSPVDKAAVLTQRVAAMGQFVSAGVDTLMAPKDFLVREMEYEEEDADAILDAAAEEQAALEEEEAAAQEEMMKQQAEMGIPPADPNAPPPPPGTPGKASAAVPGAAPQAGQGNPSKGGKAAMAVARLTGNENCGTGSGGFQPGNACAKGSGGKVDPAQGEKLGAQQSGAANRLTDEQAGAIAAYRDNVQAAELNRALRSGKLNEEQEQMANELDAAIQSMPASTEEMHVMRGVSDGSIYKGLKPGDTIEEKAFTSTSFNSELIKRDFTKPGKIDPKTGVAPMPVVMTIKLPPGTKSLYIGDDEGESDQWKEALLPRGSQFKVVSSKMKSGHRSMELELVTPTTNSQARITVKTAIALARLIGNENCGTGKGGFQPGNKCAKGSGVPPHQSDIVKDIESKYPPANPEANQSHARHMTQGDPNNPKRGDFTVARAALHDDIISELTDGVPPAEGGKIYTMMGGGPASGKSSIIKAGLAEIPEGITGDSDHIKTMLPEYNPLVESGDVGAASYVHEESSYLVKQVAKTAFENGQNFTLDGTGNSSYNSVKAKVDAAKAAGYRAEGIYVTCSTEEAVRRNIERAAKTGRLPPEQMLRDTHANVSRVVPQALADGIFDKFELYDTEVQTGGKPTLVVSARGKEVTIHRQDLYTAFVKKGEK